MRGVLALLVLVLSATLIQGAESRPNILFIMTDDHAAHAMSAYGSKLIQTPNMDRIGKEGARFENCFVTNSICTPSRAVILTGKYSHKNGVSVFNAFDGKQPTFATLLQAAGYQTAVVGKWHLFSDPVGFDYWNVLPGQGLYVDPVMIEMGKRKKHSGYATKVITDVTLDYLKRRDKSKPFCVLYHHKAPHREWTPDDKQKAAFADRQFPVPDNFFDDYKGRSSAAAEATMRIGRDMTKTDLKRTPPPGLSEKELALWNYQRYMQDYLGCVAAVDEQIGRVLDYLDQEKLTENTLVVYTSDQGFFLGEHGWYDKRFMYEESLRMPMVARLPGRIKAGTTIGKIALNVDFAQTFLELAGVAAPKEMQGRSLVPLLEGKSPADWRTSMYYRYYHYPQHHRVQPHYGVRDERYKLIYFDEIKAWELFDLQTDPREMKNVYADAKYADVVERMKKELSRLRAELGDDDSHRVPADYAEPEEKKKPAVPPDQVKLELVAHYDFTKAKDGQIVDSSGNGLHAKLKAGEIVAGRKGKALKTTGKEAAFAVPSSAKLDPSQKPLTVGCWFKAEKPDGVVMAHGGEKFGWAIDMHELRVRPLPGDEETRRETREIVYVGLHVNSHEAGRPLGGRSIGQGSNKLGEWTHVAGVLKPDGTAMIYVNGKSLGESKDPKFLIHSRPADGLSVGGDSGSRVNGEDQEPMFTGLIEDVRIYWGVLDEKSLAEWAK